MHIRHLIWGFGLAVVLIPVARVDAQSKPYSLNDVVELVKGGVPNSAILGRTRSNCIDFHLTSDVGARLHSAGADDALVAALVSNCYKAQPIQVVNVNPRPAPAKVVVLHDTVRLRDTIVGPPKPVTVVTPTPPLLVVSTYTLPEATPLVAVLGQPISSKDAKLGDRVKMTISEDVVVQHHVLIAKGAPVIAEVAEVKPAGRMGRGGKLTLRLLGTTSVDDQRVRLRGTKEAEGGDNTASMLALSVFYGVGLLRHGNDITFKEGTVFPVFVDEQIKVIPPNP